MKFSALALVAISAKLCVAAEYTSTSSSYDESSSGAECLTEGCDGVREYCDSSIGECRPASNDTECYNATIALFQDGCDPGYECIDDLCRVSADPVDGRTCHIMCSAGLYCENNTTECREPTEGECFNLATGLFQDGCDEGFYCSYNKCVDVSLDD
ncbi:Carbohydrate-binding protein [Phytophthora cinnamomi]|uniref:Carbohydrate-binding protein n=1 Tax=Phytophthora cinnamomi TaxID=4785 RepID=UPI00355A4F7E|nr:Carbohydrate-binding protein [Phytophthora cinnamomi]